MNRGDYVTTVTEELDITAIRERLAAKRGKEYWRSLEELSETPAFDDWLHREFRPNASEFIDELGRRKFLKLMGASLALAGLTACGGDRPNEKIVPYVRRPEELVLGKPLFFATAMTLNGVATGLLAESHEGRPTKLEGNPQHPGSLGSIDIFSQASVLSLYDPDRSKVVMKQGRIATYGDLLGEFRGALDRQRATRGAGIRVLSESISSPTLVSQFAQLKRDFPRSVWHQYEPVGRNNAREGSRLAFGNYADTLYNFEAADVILSLDANFLAAHPGNLQYITQFITRRRPGGRGMNRFYMVESTATNTGAKADHKEPLRASEIGAFARTIAARLGVEGITAVQNPATPELVEAVVRDLQAARGRSIVIAGESQPAAVHALAHAMNSQLGNFGKTISFIDPVTAEPAEQVGSLRRLVEDMNAGRVQMLLILGGDPAYTAPADLRFTDALSKVPLSVHLSQVEDHTSAVTTWHVPEAHYLESWSDARAYNGAITIVQPLIEPLFGGRTAHELMALFGRTPDQTGHDIVQGYWQGFVQRERRGQNFDTFWRTALHDGVVAGTELPPRQVTVSPGLASRLGQAPTTPAGALEIVFKADPSIYDGRFVNNGWLQELPKPIEKLVWDNAAIVSPSLAEREKLRNEDVVELQYGGNKILAPVWIQPGHPRDSITLYLGYGQRNTGRVGAGTGVNAYLLRTSQAMDFGSGLRLSKTGQRYTLATTQRHFMIEGRGHVRDATFEEYTKNPNIIHEEHAEHAEADLYPDYSYPGYAWGMAIDMSTCVGCNACVVACVAENNIPVVGKDQVNNSREMHWLRIDTYYKSEDLDNPETIFQPMMCVHCEKAPCEVVCPVVATAHDTEGLNVMIYNRCIGTRFCSNNCPYKVRRFNWLQYNDKKTESLKMYRNPDVTVRERGVMEKCTYCTQRISQARIHASKESGRVIRDGEVVTACQAACPADAIIFGNINDPAARVTQFKKEHRDYSVLGELNTVPRTTYLAALRNPNPAVPASPTQDESEEGPAING